MSFDLQKILEGKQARRRKLAALPIAEKLRMLDAMRERDLVIRGRAVSSDSASNLPSEENPNPPSPNILPVASPAIVGRLSGCCGLSAFSTTQIARPFMRFFPGWNPNSGLANNNWAGSVQRSCGSMPWPPPSLAGWQTAFNADHSYSGAASPGVW